MDSLPKRKPQFLMVKTMTNALEENFKIQDLHEGDIVEFPENDQKYRFGIVRSGFGMSTQAIGSKIFGVFGSTIEETLEHFRMELEMERAETEERDRQVKEKGYFEVKIGFGPNWRGYCRRQPCRIVGKVDLKTGEKVRIIG